MTTLIDVKKEPRGAYHLEVREDGDHWIKKYGDFDREVVRGYLGKAVADQTARVVELVDRLPEGSALHIAANLTEIHKKDKVVGSLPIGLTDWEKTEQVLDLVLEVPETDGPLDLRGKDA